MTMNNENKTKNTGVLKDVAVTVAWNVGILAFIWAIFMLWLPAVNFTSGGFWGFMIVSLVLVAGINGLVWFIRDENCSEHNKIQSVVAIVMVVLFVLEGIFCAIVRPLIDWSFFQHEGYHAQMVDYVEEQEADATIPITLGNAGVMDLETTGSNIIDVDTSSILIKRYVKLPAEKTSQFKVGQGTTQVFNNKLVKVYFLEYKDVMKWWSVKDTGVDTILITDASVSEAELAKMDVDKLAERAEIITLPVGMKIMPSACFGEDLYRVLRLSYPTAIFDKLYSELDEEGKPYWVAPVIEKQVGVFSGDNVKGAVILNPVTGEHKYYSVKEIPEWVDNVYSDKMIRKQYMNYTAFQLGWKNSWKDELFVTQLTPESSITRNASEENSIASHYSGGNLVAYNGDLWYYSGETSKSNDESNVGFILSNKRTKQTLRFSFKDAVAEEYTAIESIEKELSEKGYYGTFPVAIDVDGVPTYFFHLKTSAGELKRFALVAMGSHTTYALDKNLERCLKQYKNKVQVYLTGEEHEVVGVVSEIRQANAEGSTEFYINVNGTFYRLNYVDNKDVVLLNVGDEVTLTAYGEGNSAYAVLQ